MKPVFFAINRKTNRAELLTGFNHWEMVQCAAVVGIQMADGSTADGIGRCKSLSDFIKKANHGTTTVLIPDDSPLMLTIEVNGNLAEVSPSIWRSWTGKRFIEGREANGDRFLFLEYAS